LSYLPDSFSHLVNLRVLRLNDNYFTSFPDPVLKLVLLENLDLSKNNLRRFPTELGGFEKLQILALINNPWENKDDVTTAAVRLHKRGTIVHIDEQLVIEEE
jgi:Leucine-rich repeat (LRR) protein